MKNRGFTVIELVVSFTLVSVISIILFELIFSLKELYVSGDIKTTLLNKQGIMTKKIYDDLSDDTLTSITSCGVSCLIFNYQGTEKKLLVDVGANTLTYGNYTMKLSEGSTFGKLSFSYDIDINRDNINEQYCIDNDVIKQYCDKNLKLSRFSLDIPIYTNLLGEEDFGIHIVKDYNKENVAINNTISIENAIITANTIDLKIRKDTDTSNTGETIYNYWAKIFHQDHNGIDLNSEDAYFKDYPEFLKSNNTHKFSSLKSLEIFRINKNTKVQFLAPVKDGNGNTIFQLQEIDLVEEASKDKTEKEKKKIAEEYQNGYFEFLLEYPEISTTDYNLWTQTNNFVTSSTLENVYTIDIVYQGGTCKWNGLKYLTDDNAKQFVNGCQGDDYFTIGTRESGTEIKGETGTTKEVDLWVKADEYIDKYSLSVIVD